MVEPYCTRTVHEKRRDFAGVFYKITRMGKIQNLNLYVFEIFQTISPFFMLAIYFLLENHILAQKTRFNGSLLTVVSFSHHTVILFV